MELQEMLTVTENDMVGVEAREGLRTALALRRLAERLEFLHVRRARAEGMSWEQIADELQVTRQTVHRKYRRALSDIEGT